MCFKAREESVLQNLENLFKDASQYREDVEGKSKSLEHLINSLYIEATTIDQNHSSATLISATGAGISVAGGIIAISGAILAPFTGGASLVASVGAGASFLGNATRIVTCGAELVSNSTWKVRVCQILQECEQELLALKDSHEKVQQSMQELEKEKDLKQSYRDAISNMKQSINKYGPPLKTEMFTFILRSIVHLTMRLVARFIATEISKEGAQRTTFKVADFAATEFVKESASPVSIRTISDWFSFSKEASKKMSLNVANSVATGVAAAVFLPVDLYDLCKDVTHLREGAPSELAKEIRNVAKLIDKFIHSRG